MAKAKKSDLSRRRTINGHTFEWSDEHSSYDCRGAICYDDEHDETPEPSLWEAGLKLEAELKKDGFNADLQSSEKGWVEVNIFD